MKYMTIADIAELLAMSVGHVRDRVTRRKDFPAGFRIGSTLRWSREEVEDWMESRRVTRASRPGFQPAPRSKTSGSLSLDVRPSAQVPADSAPGPAA